MAIDPETPRSRRALLAAALGAGAATIASALGRPLPARATDGNPIVIGAWNTATATTTLSAVGSSADTLKVFADAGHAIFGSSSGGFGTIGASSTGYGVYGSSETGAGVYGTSNGGGTSSGVRGESAAGTGVYATSTTGTGVSGYSYMATGVDGMSTSAIGVRGYSGPGPAPSATKTGVYGYAAQDATAVGVRGESTNGTGVRATATTGVALDVAGKAQFSRSGRGTVAKGKAYADIIVPGGLTPRSMIHATLQTYRSGVAIAAVKITSQGAGKARIYLTKVASTTAVTYVGWFVAEY